MKYFMISKWGDGVGILPKIQAEGHEVAVYIEGELYKLVLQGIVPRMSIKEGVEWADYIIFDYVGFGQLADKLRQQGKKVWGACVLADKLEEDRGFAIELCKNLGIRVPETYEFNVQQAIEFLRQAKKKYIMKTDFDYSTLSFIPESNEYLIHFIQTCPLLVQKKLYLQEFVHGTEISTNIFYSHGQIIPNPDATLETKRFLNHDIGAMTGSMTSLVWVYREKEPRLYQKTLKKLEYLLQKADFNVCIDANTIVDDYGEVWFLEFTPRLGYNWLYAYVQLLTCEVSEFFAKLCEGTLTSIPALPCYATSIRVTIPPFPFEAKDPDEKILEKYFKNIPVLIKNYENIFLLDVFVKEGNLYCCGKVVYEAVGCDKDYIEAFRQAYKNVFNVEVGNKQFRTDAIANATKRINKLKQLNYFSPPSL